MSVIEAAKLPIVKIAAVALIIVSAVGVGAMTGLIPGVFPKEDPAQVDIAALAPSNPVAKQSAPATAAKPVYRPKVAAPVCYECGVVESIQAVEVKGEATGTGAVIGGVTGLVVGNQMGSGKRKKIAKVAGAAVGALAGHEIEKNVRSTVQYEIVLRMDDGARQNFTLAADDGLRVGDKVKIIDNMIVRN